MYLTAAQKTKQAFGNRDTSIPQFESTNDYVLQYVWKIPGY